VIETMPGLRIIPVPRGRRLRVGRHLRFPALPGQAVQRPSPVAHRRLEIPVAHPAAGRAEICQSPRPLTVIGIEISQ
jgi:hypothetical protein